MADGILIVEDDPDCLDALAGLVRAEGYRVVTAGDGREALEALSAEPRPALVLLDLSLPGMSGVEVLEHKAQLPGAANIPTFLVSGDDDGVTEAARGAAGVIGSMRKPLGADALLAAIARVVGLPRGGEGAAPPAGHRAEDRAADTWQRLMARLVDAFPQARGGEGTLVAAARACVAGTARACVLEWVDDGPTLRAVAHVDPGHERAMRELDIRRRHWLAVVEGATRAGEPLLARVTPDAWTGEGGEAWAAVDGAGASLLVVPLETHGHVRGAMSLVRSAGDEPFVVADVAEARACADRIAAAVDVGRSLEKASHAVRARQRLLAIVAHDMRTPLSAISLTACQLERRSDDAAVAAAAQAIARSACRLERLVRDLLDFTSIDAGRLRMQLERDSVADAVTAAVDTHRVVAGLRAIELEVEPAARSLLVLCDRERLLQILSNLMGNALKYTPARGTVRVRLARSARDVVISVEDAGPGIPPEELPRIFDEYWQSERSRGGVGLGLHITRALVEAHHGTIWVESEPGRGSRFSFSLPIDDRDGGTPRVLVVDQDASTRHQIAAILASGGFYVDVAASGADAWDALQSGEPPAVVFVEPVAPSLDGWELGDAIRADPVLSHVPTVVVDKPIRADALLDVARGHARAP